MPPLTIALLFLAGFLIIGLERNRALQVFLIAVTLIPYGSNLDIGPASFTPMRILIFFGMLRIIFKGERINGALNTADFSMILLSVVLLIASVMRPPAPDSSFITRLGNAYDIVGGYFVFRCLIKGYEDIFSIFKVTVIIFTILGIFMAYEKVKCYNLFSLLGGSQIPKIRDGKVRCSGSFGISILAGTVPATSLVWMYILRWHKNINRLYLYIGMVSSVAVIFLCTSSGPLMSLALLIVGFCTWPLRDNMKIIKSGIITMLVAFQILMTEPVWFLIAKIDLTGSSTGWHRAELMDSAIRNLNEWWFVGTNYTRHWMPTGVSWSPYQTDITNQYLRFGIDGGILAMLLFIYVISSSFAIIGKKIKGMPDHLFNHKILIWALGASLFSHTVTFFSVRYFDQSIMYFFLLLAMIGCVGAIDDNGEQNISEALGLKVK